MTAQNDDFTDADEAVSTNEDTPLSGSVLDGTSSVDGPVTVTTFTVAGDATIHSAGDTATIAGVGTLLISANGDYTFTPAANYSGPVPVATYNMTDGSSGDSSTLTISVTAANDAPTVINGTTATLADISEDATDPAGDTVQNLFGGHFSDADAGGTFAGIAITANAATTEGTWQWQSFFGWQTIPTSFSAGTGLGLGADSSCAFCAGRELERHDAGADGASD